MRKFGWQVSVDAALRRSMGKHSRAARHLCARSFRMRLRRVFSHAAAERSIHRKPAPPFQLAPWLVFFFVILALLSPTRAGSVQLLDGTVLEGEVSIDNGLLMKTDKTTTRVPLASVLRAVLMDKVDEIPPGLVLINGARLAGTFTSLAEATVKLSSGLAVPGAEIAWVVYQPFPASAAAQIPRGKTGALLPGGDFFEGTVKSADATTAKVLNPIFGPRIFDGAKKELSALILRDVKPQGASYEVVTANGSVYTAVDVVLRDKMSITIRHPLYDGLRLEAKDVVEIRASPARYYTLDDLKPANISAPPGQSPEQSFAAGKGLDGAPLKLGGKIVRGFESTANTAITWDVPAGATAFIARVGASSSMPTAQKVTFALYADSRLIIHSGPMASTDAPALLRTALPPGTKSLSLRVEGAAGSGVWGEPILLRR